MHCVGLCHDVLCDVWAPPVRSAKRETWCTQLLVQMCSFSLCGAVVVSGLLLHAPVWGRCKERLVACMEVLLLLVHSCWRSTYPPHVRHSLAAASAFTNRLPGLLTCTCLISIQGLPMLKMGGAAVSSCPEFSNDSALAYNPADFIGLQMMMPCMDYFRAPGCKSWCWHGRR